MVHTCPRCELRFATASELTEHLATDHGANAEEFERYRYPVTARRSDIDVRTFDQPKRYLVVANQTALGQRLFDHLIMLGSTGRATFSVVVPAKPMAGKGAAPAFSATLAEWRLQQLLERLHAAGLEADGVLGDVEPYRAVCRVVDHTAVDEIVLSTLPAGMSRWLDADLPARLRHKLRLPVTVVNEAELATLV
jgi:hypothetical protein